MYDDVKDKIKRVLDNYNNLEKNLKLFKITDPHWQSYYLRKFKLYLEQELLELNNLRDSPYKTRYELLLIDIYQNKTILESYDQIIDEIEEGKVVEVEDIDLIEYSVNVTVKNKIDQDKNKTLFTRYFSNQKTNIQGLKDYIVQGFPFASTFKQHRIEKGISYGYRSTNYFNSQQVFALDFDHSSLDEFLNHPDSKLFNFVYTTHSHTLEENRFRAVMIVDTLITSLESASLLVSYLLKKYPDADQAMRDTTRGIYSSDRAIFYDIGTIVTKSQVLEMVGLEKDILAEIDAKKLLAKKVWEESRKEKYKDSKFEKETPNQVADKVFSKMPVNIAMDYDDYMKFTAGLVDGVGEAEARQYVSLVWSGEHLISTFKKLKSFNGSITFGTFVHIAKEKGWL